MKFCKACSVTLPKAAFSAHAETRDRLYPICKECQKQKARAHYLANKERHRELNRAWDAANKEKRAAMNKAWRDRNPERMNAARKTWKALNPGANSSPEYLVEWRKNNKGRIAVYDRLRRSSLSRAVPAWVDFDKIELRYQEARELSDKTGVPHQVDHIVPIKSKFVCGLHVAENLQILSGADNLKKGNRHWPDMP